MSHGSQFGHSAPPNTHVSEQRPDVYTGSRGSFGISNVQFRAGAPPLRSLPLTTGFNLQSLFISRNFGPEIDIAVYDILKQNGVILNQERGCDIGNEDPTHSHWIICSRAGNETPYSEECTLLIISPWNDSVSDDLWHNSVRDLKVWIDAFLDGKNVAQVDVHVEIIDKWLYARKYTAPIVDRPDLDRDWETLIKPRVRNLLQSYEALKDEWNCIGLFHYGPSEFPEENSPTIYISFDRHCSEVTWAPFRMNLQTWLDSTNYGIGIHIEHAAPQLLARFPLTPESRTGGEALLSHRTEYEKTVRMGADISASAYTDCGVPPTSRQVDSTVGILGCYVQIQQKNGPWETFILTNYHVVRPAFDGFRRDSRNQLVAPTQGTALYAADHGGFRPSFENPTATHFFISDTVPSVVMENPSRTRHNLDIAYLERLVATDKGNKNRWSRLRDSKRAFFDQRNHELGTIFAGSGFTYRTKNDGMLDWALIKPAAGRIGLNTLPAESDWDAARRDEENRPRGKTYGAQLQHHVPLQDFSGERAFKYSAASGAICGMYGMHKHDVRYLDWKYMAQEASMTTSEHSFMRLPDGKHGSGEPGDSGSVIFDKDGHATGLLFGGQTDPETARFTYVTPIEFVFNHISAFLGVKIRIAEF
ncbi:hypothetical protein NQ176_g9903 [Zarea fungicola]|uniref:Uncharacterized protein n=1 Tax=Zarea fungicola TaxID=93591 RepID=A0ACC1MKU3_9HYPO|nr:hypothetical protein NQ176_g9903 [Lecanicillium fungicola]